MLPFEKIPVPFCADGTKEWLLFYCAIFIQIEIKCLFRLTPAISQLLHANGKFNTYRNAVQVLNAYF